jgi:hypothetical protein
VAPGEYCNPTLVAIATFCRLRETALGDFATRIGNRCGKLGNLHRWLADYTRTPPRAAGVLFLSFLR